MLKVKLFSLVVFVVLATSLIGCGRNAAPPAPATSTAGAISDVEHGVPEEVCTLCNSKLVADFKAKGDWCQEHDRPESQCFICNPSREAEFSARYEAKYGKKPPKPQ